MGQKALFTLLLALVWASFPAAAQRPVSPTSDSPATQCELHVWPSQGLRSVYYGWVSGGINDGAVTGRKGYPVVPSDPINTAQQVKLMLTIDLPSHLGLKNYRQIVHDSALDTRTIRTSTARLTTSNSPCYVELITDDIFFQQDVITGRYLKTLFRYRDFGAAATPSRVFGTFVQTSLVIFPPISPDRTESAATEIHNAFLGNFDLFAAALRKPPKAKR